MVVKTNGTKAKTKHWSENVSWECFLPQQYQIELLQAALDKNIIICTNQSGDMSFISTKVIQEYGHKVRNKQNIILLIVESREKAECLNCLRNLTDLNIQILYSLDESSNLPTLLKDTHVLISNSQVISDLMFKNYLRVEVVSAVIIYECHLALSQKTMFQTVKSLKSNSLLRIIGFTEPLFTIGSSNPGKVVACVQKLQELLNASIGTASGTLANLRYCSKSIELIVEHGATPELALYQALSSSAHTLVNFYRDHNYNLLEMYSEFVEDANEIPDPSEQPLELLYDYISVLETMGPWCANKAAFQILCRVHVLLTTACYERHFLLLCLLQTEMIKVRQICAKVMDHLDEKQALYKYASPKVLKLLETLIKYKPSVSPDSELVTQFTKTKIMLNSDELVRLQITENIIKKIPDDLTDPDNLPGVYTFKGYNRDAAISNQQVVQDNKRPSNSNGFKPVMSFVKFVRTSCYAHDGYEQLCSLLFVQSEISARVVLSLLCDLRKVDCNFWWIAPQFIPMKETAKENSKRVEEMLRKFRTKECNIVIGTNLIEQGYDLPKCNLVICFEPSFSYATYVLTKCAGLKRSYNSRDSYFVMFSDKNEAKCLVSSIARYKLMNEILLTVCSNNTIGPDLEEDTFKEYVIDSQEEINDKLLPVTMENALFLVNRYCARLPSDIFTKLAPLVETEMLEENGKNIYVCSLRLPINSPLKFKVTGHIMPTRLLAMKATAVETCRLLYEIKELDDELMPVTKENFLRLEEEKKSPTESSPYVCLSQQREYYFKRMASCFQDCRPQLNTRSYLYLIKMSLTTPLPDEQNKKGRKLHPPENYSESFSILIAKKIPKICPFPIFDRSGEVEVTIQLVHDNIVLDEENLENILDFIDFTFTDVLRLNKHIMSYDPHNCQNSYFVVPTICTDQGVEINWEFLKKIRNREIGPLQATPEEERKNFRFNKSHFENAVVMPWYRNQQEPVYYYVAEVMSDMSPTSKFPSQNSEFETFEGYYFFKYGLRIQNLNQPLLDVDRTSCRLNFLTPRHISRKGTYLPAISAQSRKEIRESLEKKQLLVPELCTIHPFPASLWRKAVTLPTILYRLNNFLLADEIRMRVASEVGLGKLNLEENMEWPTFSFGWKSDRQLLNSTVIDNTTLDLCKEVKELEIVEEQSETTPAMITEIKDDDGDDANTVKDGVEKNSDDPWVDVGTWSNDMAPDAGVTQAEPLPMFSDDEASSEDFDYDSPDSDIDEKGDEKNDNLQIEFRGKFAAEAMCENVKFSMQPWIESSFSWEGIDESIFENDKDFEKVLQEIDSSCDEKIKLIEEGLLKNNFNSATTPIQIARQKIEENKTYTETPAFIKNLITNSKSPDETCIQFQQPPLKVLNAGIIKDINQSFNFSFDHQIDLEEHPGPSPNILLQALTLSNANDGMNLERLETIGDSFLKYAITIYLYLAHPNIHEGKLSHLRSKQVSNLNLCKLGKQKLLGENIVSTKFEPKDNWLPPCYIIPEGLENALQDEGISAKLWDSWNLPSLKGLSPEEILDLVKQKKIEFNDAISSALNMSTFVPYNLLTQHSIPDKSIADCAEALIGAYLIECGPRGALLFMSWLGLSVLPIDESKELSFGYLQCPPSPMNRMVENADHYLDVLLNGADAFEQRINYKFRDRSYLLQAMTHASYFLNSLTDCYQRLEFLGDAILDYIITCHLYQDERAHSPGVLTDLRSALVNNTIFAALAVKYGFHNYFKHLSPGLHDVIQKFVLMQSENKFALNQEHYLLEEEECGEEIEAEDIEVPKALGDLFESVAGAIYLDSGMSLDTVWKVYYGIMKPEIDRLSTDVPKSPIRELLELEPDNARFSKAEKLADGKRVRVTVEVFGKGKFRGIGRNYCIAKCTAAKCALKHLKTKKLSAKK